MSDLTTTANLVLERYNHSAKNFRSLQLKTARWYDIYRGWHSGSFQVFRNNVSIPFLFSSIWADVARKINIAFGTWPYVSFFGFGPEDAASARKNELLISAQMKDSRTLIKAADMFLTGDLYGTAICQYGWRRSVNNLILREPAEFGKQRLVTEERITFDGPDWEVVDILDFFPQPGRRELDEMSWVIRRRYMELEDIEKEAHLFGTYDVDMVRELRESQTTSDVNAEMESRRNMVRSPFSDAEQRRMERFSKPIELLEMWGTVPNQFIPDDKGNERVITLANRKTIIRNRPNPFWHGHKPFFAYSPLKDPHYFHGVGKVEVGEKLQLTANRIANQKLDALDLFIDPVFLYDRNKNVDTRNLYMRAGKVIPVDGPPPEAIQALVPNLQGMQNAYIEINELWRYIQQGTGVAEEVMSATAAPGNRATAREFLGRQENVSIRLLLESRFAEEMWIEPMANGFHALNRQFLPVPKALRILGTAGIYDPITGMPQPQNIEIDLEDLNLDYDVRARGAITTINKAARQQNLVLLLQATSAHPAAMQLINWVAFFRDLFHSFELNNVDELVRPPYPTGPPTVPGQTPEGVPGAPQGPLDLASLIGLPGAGQESTLEGALSGA